MANPHLLLLLMLHLFIPYSGQLQPFQSETLFKIQQLLNYPQVLSSFSNTIDLCNIDPTPSLTLVCYEQNLTQFHIVGSHWAPPLLNFSTDSFFETVSGLSTLKVLSLVSLGLWGPLPGSISKLSSLEIVNVSSNYFSGSIPAELLSLRNLQTVVLDNNNFTGGVPHWLRSLQELAVFSVKNNSLGGVLPDSITSLENLRILALSRNNLSGEVPDLHKLTNLQVLDLEGNHFGPHFPSLHSKVLILVLRNNKFRFGIPKELTSCYQLQKLDISLNAFLGPFMPTLLSLPSMAYLDVSGNKLTGRFLPNMSCNADIGFVNLSANLFTGELPKCLLEKPRSRVVEYASNCLSNEDQEQHPSDFCHNEALAVNVSPGPKNTKNNTKAAVALGLMGGIVGVAAITSLVFLAIRRKFSSLAPSSRFVTEKVSIVSTAKLLLDARHISETMKLGATLPAYRAFALEEIKEATNNFDRSSLIYESSHKQIYQGKLADGSLVAIRSLKLRRRQNSQTYTNQIELVSKLRYCHLVSALGHCFEYGPDDSTVSVIHLIFEFVPNGTLRSWVSGKEESHGQKLDWTQRITAAISMAKGIQFLHTGIVPGVFSNNVNITDVLLDQNLHVKISTNIPHLDENGEMVGKGAFPSAVKSNISLMRTNHEDKTDIYNIGMVLLEIIVGRPIMSKNDILVVKDLLEVSFKTDKNARRCMVDPAVLKQCSDESLKIVVALCLRCLSSEAADRPSIEDVIWNLQFASQVQDSWRLDTAAT